MSHVSSFLVEGLCMQTHHQLGPYWLHNNPNRFIDISAFFDFLYDAPPFVFWYIFHPTLPADPPPIHTDIDWADLTLFGTDCVSAATELQSEAMACAKSLAKSPKSCPSACKIVFQSVADNCVGLITEYGLEPLAKACSVPLSSPEVTPTRPPSSPGVNINATLDSLDIPPQCDAWFTSLATTHFEGIKKCRDDLAAAKGNNTMCPGVCLAVFEDSPPDDVCLETIISMVPALNASATPTSPIANGPCIAEFVNMTSKLNTTDLGVPAVCAGWVKVLETQHQDKLAGCDFELISNPVTCPVICQEMYSQAMPDSGCLSALMAVVPPPENATATATAKANLATSVCAKELFVANATSPGVQPSPMVKPTTSPSVLPVPPSAGVTVSGLASLVVAIAIGALAA